MADQNLVVIGVLLVFIGFVIAAASLFFLRGGTTKTKGGAVLIIGPFPIVFGTDKKSARALLILAIILVIVLAGFFLFQQFTSFR